MRDDTEDADDCHVRGEENEKVDNGAAESGEVVEVVEAMIAMTKLVGATIL